MSGNEQGKLTKKLGEHLTELYKGTRYEVYYDHGDQTKNVNVGNIVAWLGEDEEPGRGTSLAQLDIAIVEKETPKAIALVEIEESGDRPKTLLGDVFATLIADHVRFKNIKLKEEWEFQVRDGTIFFVIALGIKPERISYIQEKVNRVLPLMNVDKEWIGKVVIETYTSKNELLLKLPLLLKSVVNPLSPKGDTHNASEGEL